MVGLTLGLVLFLGVHSVSIVSPQGSARGALRPDGGFSPSGGAAHAAGLLRNAPTRAGRPVNDVVALAGGLVVYAVFVGWAHAGLFGVRPVA
jgi:uncharacterized membrane protein